MKTVYFLFLHPIVAGAPAHQIVFDKEAEARAAFEAALKHKGPGRYVFTSCVGVPIAVPDLAGYTIVLDNTDAMAKIKAMTEGALARQGFQIGAEPGGSSH